MICYENIVDITFLHIYIAIYYSFENYKFDLPNMEVISHYKYRSYP